MGAVLRVDIMPIMVYREDMNAHTMPQTEAFRALTAQGKARGTAVRALAYAYPTHAEQLAYMAGYRASNKYADNLETHEATYSARHGGAAGNAFTDGWALAANV